MPNLPLSVIVLVHTYDQRLTRCLESVIEATEIIILDNESGIDWKKWPQIKVVRVPGPITDFSAIRNKGLLEATQDWVLFLDSDEFLSPEASLELPSILASSSADGVWIRRRDIYAGEVVKFGEVGNVYFLRLFRRAKGSFERPVHEVAVVNGPTILASFSIYHQPHRDFGEFLTKINRYAYLEASSREEYSTLHWLFEVLVYPPAKFVSNFIFKLGFLDGWRGLIYAVAMSFHSLLVRVYLYEQTLSQPQ